MNENYDFEYLNFNTFMNGLLSSMIILFNDEWTILTNMAVITNIDSRYTMRFFLVFYKMFMNYLLLNSLIAFVIEIFINYEERVIKETIRNTESKTASRRTSLSRTRKVEKETDFFSSDIMENFEDDYD